MSFLYISFGFENVSFALNIGKDAKPENLGFCTAQIQVFGFRKRPDTRVRGNPGL